MYMNRYICGMCLSLWHLHESNSSYNLFYKYVCYDWNNPYDGWTKLRRGDSRQFHLKNQEVFINIGL